MSFLPGFLSLPGGSEWLVIFVIILIIFGPRNLPKIGQAIGRGIREFKDASDGIQRTIEEEVAAVERHEKTERESQDSGASADTTSESSESHSEPVRSD